jgi:hypothetical protein
MIAWGALRANVGSPSPARASARGRRRQCNVEAIKHLDEVDAIGH